MLAKDVMTKNVITVSPEMDLKEAALVFVENNISGAPVVDENNHLKGIITEGDLVRQQKPVQKPLYLVFLDSSFPINYKDVKSDLEAVTATTVEQLMTKEIYTLPEYSDISEVATLMLQKKINRVPIVNDEGELLGIVTRQDIIRSTYLESHEE